MTGLQDYQDIFNLFFILQNPVILSKKKEVMEEALKNVRNFMECIRNTSILLVKFNPQIMQITQIKKNKKSV